jgi:hypothetical protein
MSSYDICSIVDVLVFLSDQKTLEQNSAEETSNSESLPLLRPHNKRFARIKLPSSDSIQMELGLADRARSPPSFVAGVSNWIST